MGQPAAVGQPADARAAPPPSSLRELFDTLQRTHGGPAFLTPSQLRTLRRDALSAPSASFASACAWVMSQLNDPYAAYLAPSQVGQLRERFHGVVGVGLEMTAVRPSWWRRWHDEPRMRVKVKRVVAGSTAERAGIKVGDEILDIDDTPVSSVDSVALSEWLEGEEGSRVALRLRSRDGTRTRRLSLRRAPIPVRTVTAQGLPSLVVTRRSCSPLLLRISHFGSTTALELRQALRRRASSAAPLVIDVRCNEGGLLPEAVAAARMFLPRGATVLSLWKPKRKVHTYRRRWYHRGELSTRSIPPLYVLVDENSASAAEIFAGALGASGRAVVIGTATYGKGASQALAYMSDGSAVRFTVYTLRVGSTEWDLACGVRPDVQWRWRSRWLHSRFVDGLEVTRALRRARLGRSSKA
ncbi:hypothetical protein AB1Y20_003610 [Prymnesium parvum]|uniref:PDZ domain-containing protein n=1 Tax=Prymnesium parvum TaxID=97485 RepID=A0AB34J5Q1_PRYPA